MEDFMDKIQRLNLGKVTLEDMIDGIGRFRKPYHPIEQIVPEKVGELWRHIDSDGFFHTDIGLGGMVLNLIGWEGKQLVNDSIIHGEHWTRVFPTVKEQADIVINVDCIAQHKQGYLEIQPIPFDLFPKDMVGREGLKLIIKGDDNG